jgi:ferrous iron transport protein B
MRRCVTDKKLTLADLQPGESARITAVHAEGALRHRLLDFGFRCGERVTLIRRAPLADPIQFKLRGAYISLRKADAGLIEAEKAA